MKNNSLVYTNYLTVAFLVSCGIVGILTGLCSFIAASSFDVHDPKGIQFAGYFFSLLGLLMLILGSSQGSSLRLTESSVIKKKIVFGKVYFTEIYLQDIKSVDSDFPFTITAKNGNKIKIPHNIRLSEGNPSPETEEFDGYTQFIKEFELRKSRI